MVRYFKPVGGKYGGDKSSSNSQSKPSDDKSRNGGGRSGGRSPAPIAGKSNGGDSRRGKSNSKGDSRGKTPPDASAIKSRREVNAVTMNLSGSSLMGLTPKYKINLIETFLENFPDIVFIQDSIEREDLTKVLESVSEGKYESFFHGTDDDDGGGGDKAGDGKGSGGRRGRSSKDNKDRRRKGRSKSRDRNGGGGSRRGSVDRDGDDDEQRVRSMTGIAWNREKYFGAPLQMGDERLKEWAKWLRDRDLSVVRLDSRERLGIEDVYPSLIAISWHGKDYTLPMRKRARDCEDFLEFLCTLREKNWNVPILVGGDFNLDMKSFDLKPYPGLILVPYRPISGSLAKDLKNTFMYTMDSLQVTETGFKQHHPETFPNPFITAKVRGRHQMRIWAVVRIQRAVRRWIRVRKERQEYRVRAWDDRRRWRKKIEGRDYRSDEEEDFHSARNDRHDRHDGVGKNGLDEKGNKKFDKTPKKDRKYALYWDERDDPRYQQEMTEEEYNHRRRKDFLSSEGKKSVMDDMYDKQPMTVQSYAGGHRRKKYNDLRSIYDKKKEEQELIDIGMMRSWD